MKFKDTKIDEIYEVRSDLSQWDTAIIIFKQSDEKFDAHYSVTVISAPKGIVEPGERDINKNSRLSQEATLELLGTVDKNPEYLL